MKILVITGLSGAGKSQVVNTLEELDYFCVDNLPAALIPKFGEIYKRSFEASRAAALVCDMRGGDLFEEFSDRLKELEELGCEYEVLFLDASDEVLVRRYKETRSIHPSAGGGRIIDGIQKERKLLASARENATHIIDTSNMTPTDLKKHIKSIYGSDGIVVDVLSFGFKYGIPLDADLVFDVRFLPNPYYIPELKEHVGLEACVHDYVMQFEQSTEFLKRLTDMIDYLLPHYIEEGKSQLVIGIGCTGGHHRSVTIAEELYKYLQSKDCRSMISHRDIKKGV